MTNCSNIAQQELQSERAALFRPTDDGRPEFVASVNLTRMELESDGMRSCMEWLESILRNAASTHSEHQRLCLALDVGEPYPWLLYMDSAFTSGMFQRLSPALLHDLALFHDDSAITDLKKPASNRIASLPLPDRKTAT